MTISLVGPVIITQSCSVVTFLLRKSTYTLGGVSSGLTCGIQYMEAES